MGNRSSYGRVALEERKGSWLEGHSDTTDSEEELEDGEPAKREEDFADPEESPRDTDTRDLNARRPFTGTTYGAFYIALLRLLHEPFSPLKAMAAISCGFWHIVVMIVQILSMWLMSAFAVERLQDPYERRENLGSDTDLLITATATNQSLNPTLHPQHKAILDLCMNDHYVPGVESLFVWIWSMKLTPMLWQSVFLIVITQFMSSPPPSFVGHFMQEDPQDLKRKIVTFMSPNAKVICNLLINLPRMGICMYLFWIGATFLCFANSVEAVLIKSVGLVFISTLPEIFFYGALSEKTQKDTTSVGLAFQRFEDPDTEGRTHLNTWVYSLCKFIFTLYVTLLMTHVVFGDVFAFRRACTAYKYQFVEPLCAPICGSHYFGHTFFS